MAVEVKAKQWGNSIGVVIPLEVVKRLQIKPEEKLVIEIEKKTNVLHELFGAVKFKRPASEIVKEARKELEGKWLR